MARQPKISDAQIAAALKRHRGVRRHAEMDLGCTTQNLSYRIKKSKKLQIEDAGHSDETSGLAMRRIIKWIEKGHLPTCRWYLNRFGKHRFDNALGERLSPAKLLKKQLDAMILAMPKDPEIWRRAAIKLGIPAIHASFEKTKRN